VNIYNDKDLYKLIIGALVIFAVAALGLSAVAGGMKAFLFMLWVIVVLVIFWGVVGVTLVSGLSTSSKVSTKRAASGYIDFYLYYLGLCVLGLFFLFTSVYVWAYLDRTYPSLEKQARNPVPVSAIIPKHG